MKNNKFPNSCINQFFTSRAARRQSIAEGSAMANLAAVVYHGEVGWSSSGGPGVAAAAIVLPRNRL